MRARLMLFVALLAFPAQAQLTEWEPMIVPTDAHLYAVSGTGPDDVYAVGEGGVIAHYNGDVWSIFSLNLPQDLIAVTALGDDVYAATVSFIYRRNTPTEWEALTDQPSVDVTGLGFPGDLHAAGTIPTVDDPVIRVLENGSWETACLVEDVSVGSITATFMPLPGARYIGTDAGRIFTEDFATPCAEPDRSGFTWSDPYGPIGTAANVVRAFGGLPITVFFAATDEGIYRSLGEGNGWALEDSFAARGIFAAGEDAWAVGDDGAGQARIFERSGGNWSELETDAPRLHAIWGVTVDDLFAVGDDGTVLYRGINAPPPDLSRILLTAQRVPNLPFPADQDPLPVGGKARFDVVIENIGGNQETVNEVRVTFSEGLLASDLSAVVDGVTTACDVVIDPLDPDRQTGVRCRDAGGAAVSLGPQQSFKIEGLVEVWDVTDALTITFTAEIDLDGELVERSDSVTFGVREAACDIGILVPGQGLFEIYNDGPDPCVDSVLIAESPTDWSAMDAQTPGCSLPDTRTLRCELGDLRVVPEDGSGGDLVQIPFTPRSGLDGSVRVETITEDRQPANNNEQFFFDVGEPPRGGCQCDATGPRHTGLVVALVVLFGCCRRSRPRRASRA